MRATAVSLLVAAAAICWSAASAAAAVPAGSGGCSALTVACYPECRWEWTGTAGQAITNPPVDAGYCPVPEPVEGNGGAPVHVVADSGAVAVSNWPATQPVSGTVTAAQASGDRWRVDARCEVGVPCVADSNPTQVAVTNDDANGVPVRLASGSESNVGIVTVVGGVAGLAAGWIVLWAMRHYRRA